MDHWIYVHLSTRPPTVWQGELEAADPLLVRAIEIQERALGRDHPHLAAGLGTRARVLQAQVSQTSSKTTVHGRKETQNIGCDET